MPKVPVFNLMLQVAILTFQVVIAFINFRPITPFLILLSVTLCLHAVHVLRAGWPEMSAALAGSEADTSDTQPTDQEDQS